MQQANELDLKKEFKNLVRKVKYALSIDQEKDVTNEEIAIAMDLQPPYFNSLVGTKGKVTAAHIEKIRQVYRDILGEVNLTNNNIAPPHEKSGPSEPDYQKKYIVALEKTIEKQESLLTKVAAKLTEVEQELIEVKENQLVSYSIQEAFQKYWVEHFHPDKDSREAAAERISQIAFSSLKKYQKEGIHL